MPEFQSIVYLLKELTSSHARAPADQLELFRITVYLPLLPSDPRIRKVLRAAPLKGSDLYASATSPLP